jgi:DNA-directed RNA polymerase specialized sigma24 family protein
MCSMPANPHQVLQKLDEVDDWPGLMKKMIGYGVWLARTEYRWRRGTILPKGNDIKDLVYTVVKKLYSGERTWDPGRVSLESWLRLNIRSEMNNLFRSAYTCSGALREVPLEGDDKRGQTDQLEGQAVDEEISRLRGSEPEIALLEKESKKQCQLMLEALFEAVEGDQVLDDIFYEICDGCERKPRVLAQRLGIPKREINNALKRLDRRAQKILTRQEGNSG